MRCEYFNISLMCIQNVRRKKYNDPICFRVQSVMARNIIKFFNFFKLFIHLKIMVDWYVGLDRYILGYCILIYHENLWFWASFAPIAKFSEKITKNRDFLAHFKHCTWTKWAQDKGNASSLLAVIESFLTCFHFHIFGWKVEKFGVIFERSDMRKNALFNFNWKFQTYF